MNFQAEMIRRRINPFVVCAVGLVLTMGLGASGVPGQSRAVQRDEGDAHSEIVVMQAVLAEVRQLHQDLGRWATATGRLQVTVQQMQVQEQRLNHASLQLEDVRKRIDVLLTERAANANHLQALEDRLDQEQDANLRRDMEQQKAGTKSMIEQSAAREAQLRAQEADAASVVQTEQNKWQDLSDQISTLTQSLGSSSTVSPSEN